MDAIPDLKIDLNAINNPPHPPREIRNYLTNTSVLFNHLEENVKKVTDKPIQVSSLVAVIVEHNWPADRAMAADAVSDAIVTVGIAAQDEFTVIPETPKDRDLDVPILPHMTLILCNSSWLKDKIIADPTKAIVHTRCKDEGDSLTFYLLPAFPDPSWYIKVKPCQMPPLSFQDEAIKAWKTHLTSPAFTFVMDYCGHTTPFKPEAARTGRARPMECTECLGLDHYKDECPITTFPNFHTLALVDNLAGPLWSDQPKLRFAANVHTPKLLYTHAHLSPQPASLDSPSEIVGPPVAGPEHRISGANPEHGVLASGNSPSTKFPLTESPSFNDGRGAAFGPDKGPDDGGWTPVTHRTACTHHQNSNLLSHSNKFTNTPNSPIAANVGDVESESTGTCEMSSKELVAIAECYEVLAAAARVDLACKKLIQADKSGETAGETLDVPSSKSPEPVQRQKVNFLKVESEKSKNTPASNCSTRKGDGNKSGQTETELSEVRQQFKELKQMLKALQKPATLSERQKAQKIVNELTNEKKQHCTTPHRLAAQSFIAKAIRSMSKAASDLPTPDPSDSSSDLKESDAASDSEESEGEKSAAAAGHRRMSSHCSSAKTGISKMCIRPKEPTVYDGFPNTTAFHRLVHEAKAYPFPGENDVQEENRFLVYTTTDTQHVIMDNMTGEDVLIETEYLEDPSFQIGFWYACKHQMTLGLDPLLIEREERYCMDMLEVLLATIETLLNKAHGESASQFIVMDVNEDTFTILDIGWNMAADLPKESLSSRDFNLFSWFEANAKEAGEEEHFKSLWTPNHYPDMPPLKDAEEDDSEDEQNSTGLPDWFKNQYLLRQKACSKIVSDNGTPYKGHSTGEHQLGDPLGMAVTRFLEFSQPYPGDKRLPPTSNRFNHHRFQVDRCSNESYIVRDMFFDLWRSHQ
ncbi:hypothetical protein B0H17DRAFT_1149768 [Mycena rosella]|uniref:Uncharacterized protein n=1 Tax=Mycena rosella TaxID=1033263 RepID=A0AAD7BYE0_MYCRO|nr:hypothetical protein B0H17DRAFT_1149768 [Mycena rosella]